MLFIILHDRVMDVSERWWQTYGTVLHLPSETTAIFKEVIVTLNTMYLREYVLIYVYPEHQYSEFTDDRSIFKFSDHSQSQ